MEGYLPISLPSKCKAYGGIDPNSICIRPFTGKEHQLTKEITSVNIKKKLVTLLSNVLVGIDPLKLTSGDVLYIVLWEAINSYSNLYPLKIYCENCLQEIEVNVDLNAVESIDLPDNFSQPFDVQLTTGPLKLRLPTLRDEIEVLDMERLGHSTYLYSLALCIESEESSSSWVVKMEEWSSQDIMKLEQELGKYIHGPTMGGRYICPKCSGEGTLIIPFRADRLFSART